MNIIKNIKYYWINIISMEYFKKFTQYKFRNKKILINGKDYSIFFHSYNNYGLTERVIEVPIIEYYLDYYKPFRTLEIGNVSNYYYQRFYDKYIERDVVDKYERGFGVITSDIALFKSQKLYNLIFSISTFEHMDSDLGRNPDFKEGSSIHGTLAADNIIYVYENLLENGGIMVITSLLNYTPEWDQTFLTKILDQYHFTKLKKYIFEKKNENEWVQLSENEVKELIKNLNDFQTLIHKTKYLSVLEIKK